MGYLYKCDGCGEIHRDGDFPPFTGEFSEQFIKGEGGDVAAAGYTENTKVTLCGKCIRQAVGV